MSTKQVVKLKHVGHRTSYNRAVQIHSLNVNVMPYNNQVFISTMGKTGRIHRGLALCIDKEDIPAIIEALEKFK